MNCVSTPLLIDLTQPIKAAFKWLMNQLLAGVESLLSMLVGLLLELLSEFIYLDPGRLQEMEPIWSLSFGLYFSLLSIVALAVLGLVQLFPSASEIDPFRLGERAFAATIALLVVNPPGSGDTLFGKGLFAWAFVLVNGVERLFLAQAGEGIELTLSLTGIADGVAAVTALVFVGYFLGISALLSIGTLMVLLGLRQLLLYAVYGLFPLLILFWVVDVGPPKYANQVAQMAFKAAGILLLSGILVSGLVATSVTIIDGMGSGEGTGSIQVAGAPNNSSPGGFGSANATAIGNESALGAGVSQSAVDAGSAGFARRFLREPAVSRTGAVARRNGTDIPPPERRSRFAGRGNTTNFSNATKLFDSGGSSLEDNSGDIAEVLIVVLAVVAMCFGGSSILGIAFSMSGLGSLAAGAKSGLSSATGKAKGAMGGGTDGDGSQSADNGDSEAGKTPAEDAGAADGEQTGSFGDDDSAVASETDVGSDGTLQNGGDSFGAELTNPSATTENSDSSGLEIPSVAGLAGAAGASSRKGGRSSPSTAGKASGPAAGNQSPAASVSTASVGTATRSASASDQPASGSSVDPEAIETREEFGAVVGDDLDEESQDAIWAMHETHSGEDGNSYLKDALSGGVSDGVGTAFATAGMIAGGPVGMVAAGAAVGAVKSVSGSAVDKHYDGAVNAATDVGRSARQAVSDIGGKLKKRTATKSEDIRDVIGSMNKDSFEGDKYA